MSSDSVASELTINTHPLGVLNSRQQVPNINWLDGGLQKLEVETATNYGGSRQDLPGLFTQSSQSAPEYEPDILRDVVLVQRKTAAESAARVEDLALLDQVLINLFDKKRIALSFLES